MITWMVIDELRNKCEYCSQKGEKYEFFVQKHSGVTPLETRKTISNRYKTVTKAINKEFWNILSDTQNSMYVGSYGRRTAINTSDLDILVLLPEREYIRFDSYNRNGQSRLLQAVKYRWED